MPVIKNEIVNYLNSGARYDFFYNKFGKLETVFEFTNSPEIVITEAKIRLYYQQDGKLIKEWTVVQPAAPSFKFEVAAGEFSDYKNLNYWIEAFNQDGQVLFYGAFTLRGSSGEAPTPPDEIFFGSEEIYFGSEDITFND